MKRKDELFRELKKQLNNVDSDFNEALTNFLVCNKWFDIKTEIIEEIAYVDELSFFSNYEKFSFFFNNRNENIDNKIRILRSLLSGKYSITSSKLNEFFKEFDIPKHNQYFILDFFLKYIKKDVFLFNDKDLEEINIIAFSEMTKINGDIMNYFFKWYKENNKVNYIKDYYFTKRYTCNTDAYDEEEYIQLLFYLFNEEYISENNMIQKAIESQDYVDTWVFLAIHFVSAIRNTDMLRIPHPRLPYSPEEVLKKIYDNSFTNEDARITLSTIISRLNNIPLKPNKTKNYNNISNIKICIPYSIEVLMGTIFAISEAHYQINHKKRDTFIRIIKTYEQINKYMGEEIGGLFINSNFKTRSMNKSYLQSICALADDILIDEDNNEFQINGYILAALARSHKGSYGSFAQTTATYIKDAKLSGLSPEFVARELFERGVLSSIASMLLKMIINDKNNPLPVKQQTLLIKELNLSPREIEKVISLYNASKNKAFNNIKSILSTDPKERKKEIIKALHRIGNGNAVSKDNDVDCIFTAFNKICPFNDKNGACAACEYNCGNKSTIYYLAEEFNRLLSLYRKTDKESLKNKYKYIIQETILPTMNELIMCSEEIYGSQMSTLFERIIKETINE